MIKAWLPELWGGSQTLRRPMARQGSRPALVLDRPGPHRQSVTRGWGGREDMLSCRTQGSEGQGVSRAQSVLQETQGSCR